MYRSDTIFLNKTYSYARKLCLTLQIGNQFFFAAQKIEEEINVLHIASKSLTYATKSSHWMTKWCLILATVNKCSDFTRQCVSWRLCISLAQMYFHSPNTLTERFRVSLSVKRSVLFFSSSEWMCSAPVFDVPWALVWSTRLAVALSQTHAKRERERESLT